MKNKEKNKLTLGKETLTDLELNSLLGGLQKGNFRRNLTALLGLDSWGSPAACASSFACISGVCRKDDFDS